MAYELDVIEQVVHGSLAPWLFPQEHELQKHWQVYLQRELTYATRQIHAGFTQHKSQYDIQQVRQHLFDRQQLPAFMQQKSQVQVPEVDGERLLALLLSRISLDKSSITEWYHWQDEQGQLQLEAYVRVNWGSLSYEEQRYYFYQQLLQEQVQLFEQNIRDFVRAQPTRQSVENYLQRHQKALLRYADQLMDNLGSDQAVFTPSGSYLLTDVVRLIQQQVDRLSDLLTREFTEYLDPDLPVPYSHKVLTLSKYQVLVEELSRRVNHQVEDEALQKLLQEVLGEFKALPLHPTNLQQLKYWQVFLPHLDKLLKNQSDPDTATEPDTEPEHFLTGLTAINFNHPGFLAWCQDLFARELGEQLTPSAKLDRLYYFQKLIRQVRLLTEFSFMPKHASLQAQLSDWIREEISYYQQMAEKELIHSTQQAGIESIPTNMTVAQVALLLRLLQETDLLPKQNKARMFRAFSQVLLTQNQQEIAAESLKAKYNQLDEHSMRVLKEKVKAMLDLLNHPTHWQ